MRRTMKRMTRIQMSSQPQQLQQESSRPIQLQSRPGLPKRRLAVPRSPPGRRAAPQLAGIILGCAASLLGIR